MDVGQRARAGARRCARSWRGVEVGEEQADRDRLGAALARAAAARRSGSPSPSGSTTPVGPDPLGRLEAQLAARPAAPASARRGGRGGGGPGGRSRAGRRSRGSRSAPCGRRVPRAGRWCRPSSRGRRPRPSRGLGAGPRQHRLDRARSRPADWSSGVVGTFAVWTRSPSNRTASVKVPPTSTPSSMRSTLRSAPAPRGGSRRRGRATRWTPSSSGSMSGKSVRRWPPRDSRALQGAGRDRRGQRVGVGEQLARGRSGSRIGPAQRQTASRVSSVGGSKRQSGGSAAARRRGLLERRARRRGRRRRSTR